MQSKFLERHWWTLVLSGVAILLLGAVAFFGLLRYISWEVAATGEKARQSYPGDSVEALIQWVDCPGCYLRDRNRAVWALGQLGDPRALPVLRQYYNGEACNHEADLCQRELDKSIRKIEARRGSDAKVKTTASESRE